MRLLKQVFHFYISSSFHVALAVLSLSWVSLMEFDLPYDGNILYFNLFATITGYNFIKYYGIAKWHHRSLATTLKAIQIFSLVCFLAMCYYVFQLNFRTLAFVSICGVITFFYAIPFLPKKLFIDNDLNLRNISRLKIYVIALVWAVVTVLLPLINAEYSINGNVAITLIQRFVFILALMVPFEIRDLKYDDLKLSTIPQRIGIKLTKIIGIVLLVVFFFLQLLKANIQFYELAVLLIITIVSIIFVAFSTKNQSGYYSSFWVEGIPIFWILLLKIII